MLYKIQLHCSIKNAHLFVLIVRLRNIYTKSVSANTVNFNTFCCVYIVIMNSNNDTLYCKSPVILICVMCYATAQYHDKVLSWQLKCGFDTVNLVKCLFHYFIEVNT